MAGRDAGVLQRVRGVAYSGYYRVAGLNYHYRGVARPNRTPVANFRCFEPLNRHGDDPMLVAIDRVADAEAVIYDLGANVGIYALALATAGPSRLIIAVEPAPNTVSRLETNIAANGLEDRIEVVACGVGAADREGRFYESTHVELSAFQPESATRWGARVRDVHTVPVRRLETLVADRPAPDVLKIDVEGAGPAVLRGASDVLERYRPMLFIEIHEEGLDTDVAGSCRTLLEEHGYEIDPRAGFWQCVPPESGR